MLNRIHQTVISALPNLLDDFVTTKNITLESYVYWRVHHLYS